MASFSEQNVIKKLSALNSTQQSIQSLSSWLIHHRKQSQLVVATWMKELNKSLGSKKLTLFYLANDIIQNSKRKGPEYNRDFKVILPEACINSVADMDEKIKASLQRVFKIWLDRKMYDNVYIDSLISIIKGHPKSSLEIKSTPPEKSSSETSLKQIPSDTSVKKSEPTRKKKKMELSLREEIELEMKDAPGEAPSAEELIQALLDLESCASNDTVVREKIASLPPEASDVTLLEKLSDTAEADALMKIVDEACSLLTDYNARLAQELSERKNAAKMLRNYIHFQKRTLNDSGEKLVEYKKRLEKVDVMYKELKSHVQSLPDFTLLPSITGGLAPLPSAGDLFSTDKT